MKHTFKKPINTTISIMVKGTRKQVSDTWCDFLDFAEDGLKVLKQVLICLIMILSIALIPITAPIVQIIGRYAAISAWKRWYKFNPWNDCFMYRYKSLKCEIKKSKESK